MATTPKPYALFRQKLRLSLDHHVGTGASRNLKRRTICVFPAHMSSTNMSDRCTYLEHRQEKYPHLDSSARALPLIFRPKRARGSRSTSSSTTTRKSMSFGFCLLVVIEPRSATTVCASA